MSKPTTRQRMERMVEGGCKKSGYPTAYVHKDDVLALLQAEHRRLRAKVRKLHQRYTTGIYGDSPVDYFVEDLLKAMR